VNCQERKDLMLLYVAGALEPGEETELRGHLSRGCPQCAGALAEAETTLHQVPLGLVRVGAPAGAWERIESRVALKEQMAPEQSVTDRAVLDAPFTRRRGGAGMWLGWAAAAVIAVAVGVPLRNANKRLDENKVQIAALETQAGRVGKLEETVGTLQVQLNEVKTQDQAMSVKLASAEKLSGDLQQKVDMMMKADSAAVKGDAQAEAQGRLFWDKSTGMFTLYVSNAKAVPEGKMYQLWILPQDGKPMPSTVEAHDQAGMLVLSGKVPAGAGAPKGAAVTIEPPGGSAEPTMPLQFAAVMGP
jgi:anti-sigma-K factor RskA